MASQIFEILRKPGYNYLTQVSSIFLTILNINTEIDNSSWRDSKGLFGRA